MFRVGDKVTQIRNNYDKGQAGVFNGTIGVVTALHPDEQTLTVRTDEDESIEYDFDELDELAHAYDSVPCPSLVSGRRSRRPVAAPRAGLEYRPRAGLRRQTRCGSCSSTVVGLTSIAPRWPRTPPDRWWAR